MRQGVMACGFTALISAYVSMVNCFSRSSVPTRSARARAVEPSYRSRELMTLDRSRWRNTRNSIVSRSVSGAPRRSITARAISSEAIEWSRPEPLPMSCISSANRTSQGSSISLIRSVKRPSVTDFERSDGHQRVLIHGVAMIEIPHHQAFDVAPLRQRARQDARFLHRPQAHRCLGQGEHALPVVPFRFRSETLQPLDGIRRQPQAMPRHELEQAQILRRLVRPQQHAVARYGELAGGKSRPPFVKPAQERARLLSGNFDGLPHRLVHHPGVAIIVAHQRSRMFAQRFLGVEAQRVLIPPGQFMQPETDAGEETERGR